MTRLRVLGLRASDFVGLGAEGLRLGFNPKKGIQRPISGGGLAGAFGNDVSLSFQFLREA